MICVNTTSLFHVVKLVHVILSTVLILTEQIVNKNANYKMLIVFDQNTVEYRIPF